MELVGKDVPQLSIARRMERSEDGLGLFSAAGVVGMIEAGSMEQDLAACKALADSGALAAYGSDWPSGPLNPLANMYVGRARVNPTAPGTGPCNPDLRLSLEFLVKAATLNGAILMQLGDVTGSLVPGKYADLVVLDRDIFERPIEEQLQTRVLTTCFKWKHVPEGPVNASEKVY